LGTTTVSLVSAPGTRALFCGVIFMHDPTRLVWLCEGVLHATDRCTDEPPHDVGLGRNGVVCCDDTVAVEVHTRIGKRKTDELGRRGLHAQERLAHRELTNARHSIACQQSR